MSLPTLLQNDTFQFIDTPNNEEKSLLKLRAIDAVLTIMKKKLDRVGFENRFLILKAATGSGKSTIFPQEIYNQICQSSGRGTWVLLSAGFAVFSGKLFGEGVFWFCFFGFAGALFGNENVVAIGFHHLYSAENRGELVFVPI